MSRSLDIRPAAALAAALAVALLGLEYLLNTPSEDALREFLVVLAIIGVGTAVVFGLVVPRASRSSARSAIVLAVLALLGAGVFWAGLSPVLAVGAIVLARRADGVPGSRAALVIAALALVADLAAIGADAVVNG